MRRPNLKVLTHALATRILFDGRRARGVEYSRGGVTHRARAGARADPLAADPINSPQLLKLSGVGPAAELRAHGIDGGARICPGVGENLQDHLEFYFQVACKEPITLYSSINWWSRALIGARWLLRKDGLGATNHFETCGFIRSRAGIAYPDIQYHFLPMAVAYDGSTLAQEHGFQAHVGPMRSKSRGWVRLASADPLDKPRILFNYLSQPDDWTEMRACVRLTREIFAQPAFDRYRGREIQPGADVQTDEQIDAFIRAKVESAYHPSCSCKMGRSNDPMAVVDPETRVHGVEGLRVVDSSIMPSVTTGNLNAPTIMLAEKAADHILGRGMLPRGAMRRSIRRRIGRARSADPSANPPNDRLLARNRRSRRTRMSDDDGSHRHPSLREPEGLLARRRVQIALREADPAAAESQGMGHEHQVLGRERAVLDDPWTGCLTGNKDQQRRVVENLKSRVAEHGVKMRGASACGHIGRHGRQHMSFCGLRNPIEQGQVPHHGEGPRLLVDRIGRLGGGSDETADGLLIDRTALILANRAPLRNRFHDVHMSTLRRANAKSRSGPRFSTV